MNRTMLCLLIAWLVNTGVIVWAHTIELFYFSGFQKVLHLFWGRIVVFDFVAALLLIGLWITLLHRPEQRVTRGLLWTVAVIALGTPMALLFFILRARRYMTAKDVFFCADK
jgi:hypothetical protein